MFKPMKLTNGKDDTPVLVQYPPDPLHIVLLGPCNNCLSKLEEKYPQEMSYFYNEYKFTKKGQGIGGTFNGPSIKDILQESMLNKLEAILPSSKDVGVAINYLRNLRELHRVCLENEIDPDYKLILDDFENNFNHLYENIELNMTLKVHVILHHFTQYFELTNSTMKDTNGEFVETLHSSLRIHEEKHGFKIVRKLGTTTHLKKSKSSLVSFNSKRAGFSPAWDLTLRKKSSPRPTVYSPIALLQ